MTLRRAALYLGGASLLVAWFSSAASLSLSRSPSRSAPEREPQTSAVEDLAVQVQQQSKRLRERLATAPTPNQPARNPFRFREVVPPPQPVAPRPSAWTSPAAPAPASEPLLTLIGVAEQNRPEGPARTAVFATIGDQVIMATVGDVVLQRYRVIAVTPAAAELTDLVTGQTRRLALDMP